MERPRFCERKFFDEPSARIDRYERLRAEPAGGGAGVFGSSRAQSAGGGAGGFGSSRAQSAGGGAGGFGSSRAQPAGGGAGGFRSSGDEFIVWWRTQTPEEDLAEVGRNSPGGGRLWLGVGLQGGRGVLKA